MAYVDEIGTVIHSRDYPVDSIPDIIAHDLRGIAHFDVKLQVRYKYVDPIYPGPGNTTTLIAESKACSEGLIDLFAGLLSGSTAEDLHGIAHFDVKLRVCFRFIDPLSLWTAKVGNFNQGPKNTTTVVAQSGLCKKGLMADVDEIGTVIHSRDYPVDSIPDIIAHDLHGIVHFDVRLQVRYSQVHMPSEIAEEYKNFCDRPKDQRPQREEVIGNGATYSTSELSVLKNNEVRTWDRGYDEEGNQVWGANGGPYEFKPAPTSSFNDIFSPLNFPAQPLDKRIQGSFVLQE
ncbi:hypothetical protein ACH5RR_033088 [Cinchona calisaya]|uniref:Uncharacterized protein n=1 Tax=Cinchona calisaya TaxID=153742 RepID=A0ABD2YLA1_9GENT